MTSTTADARRSPITPPGARSTGSELMEVAGSLRRSVRRTVRQDWPHRPLTESEVELLRLVGARPGLRVREAASALALVPNTVSTLIRRLSDQGLIDRRGDEQDGRAARLHLSPAAARRMAQWRDRRQQVVDAAMLRLPAGDRAAIARALPALRRLTGEVTPP